MKEKFKEKIKRIKIFINFDTILVVALAVVLMIFYSKVFPMSFYKFIIIPISVISTIPVFFSAIKALKNKKITIDLLASVALVISLIKSQWPSVIFIGLMIASARIFSNYTQIKSRQAIESLLKLKPQKAKIQKNGKFFEVPINEVKKGDLVLVELGERIPIDGIIEKGEAEIDQSSLTGESLPVFKKEGDLVLSSTIIHSGNLIIKTEKIGEETTIEKIIKLVNEAHKYKAPINTLSDRFSFWYIILTLVGSGVLYVFTHNLSLILAVLLVTCADDVAVAVPMAFLSSIAHAAKHGAIIKGGDFLEALAKLKVVVVDKTGTLTKGRLKVEDIFVFNEEDKNKFLKLAAVISSISSHPSSQAIMKYVKEKNIATEEPENFEEYAGKGAIANYKGEKIISGKTSFLKEIGINITNHQLEDIEREKEKGHSINLIGYENKVIGFIALADELRPETKETINQLRELGIKKIIMLTGDNEKIAKRISNLVGIDEYHANLLPDEKLEYLKKYLNKNYKVAMIGDGVNDAAVLSLADVGIAMGTIGSDAAVESADIALMKDDLMQVPELIRIGKTALKTVHQDFLIWGITNSLGIILVFIGLMGPEKAAAYNFITDFFPIINSLRLFK